MKRVLLPLVLVLVVCSGALAAEAPKDQSPLDQALERIDFSGLFFLSYEYGDVDGEDINEFFVDRAYLTAEARILPFLSGRLTLDTSQDREGDGEGDMEVRLKYAYAKLDLGEWRMLRKLQLEAGIVHMVWLDFEEHVNLYRMRSPMFIERSGVFNSADFGMTLTGLLGPELDQEYRRTVNPKYAGRHGSFAVGIYNGGGYHGHENNSDKVVEGRLTLRPLPDSLPGLQISGLAILGKGNRPGEGDEIPDWETLDVMVSYESSHGAATAQYVSGAGNQKGTWVEPGRPWVSTDFDGWAVFGERRLGPHWRVIGGFDRLQRETVEADLGYRRSWAGVAYDLGRRNMVVVDWDRRSFNAGDRDDETRYQVTFQLVF